MTHEEFSRKGGKATSERKKQACRENWKKAVEARRNKAIRFMSEEKAKKAGDWVVETYPDVLRKLAE